MTINFSSALTDNAYIQRLKAFMKTVEGEALSPYVDTTGNPTIGWGFALNLGHVEPKTLSDIIETVLGVNPNLKDLSDAAIKSETAWEVKLTH